MTNEQTMMLRRLSSVQFALAELTIFLDTHPNNAEALKMFNMYSEKYERLMTEYQRKYGPIVARDSDGNTDWEWINSPWPWENTKEMRK